MALLADSDRLCWEAFVRASPQASAYHQIGWKDVIERSFGHRTFYLLSRNESNAIDGVLPLVQLRSYLFGNFLVSLPYVNYGGACAASRESLDRLLAEARLIAVETRAEHIELRHSEPLYAYLPVKTGKVAMVLSLPDDAETLLRSFPSKLRSQIRRPHKEGMVARIGREDELDHFYAVFSQNMRDLGTPVYSMSFFRNILDAFPDSTWICTVSSREGRPVASGFLVGFRERMEIPWASSLRKFKMHSPNMLLYWSALEFACQAGYRVFDFGRSTPDEGTYRFKAQWGTQPVQLYWHYWLKNGGVLPELNPKNPKFQLAIRLWRMLPVPLTRVLGPMIVKNIP